MTPQTSGSPGAPVYDDDYATCLETYATFRISSTHHDCTQLRARIGVAPTTCQPSRARTPQRNIWQLCSQNALQSRDTRRHVDWLLDMIEPVAADLDALRAEGAQADIFCYFVNVGHGGPMLSPAQLVRLAKLRVDIGWDVYSGAENDDLLPTGEPR